MLAGLSAAGRTVALATGGTLTSGGAIVANALQVRAAGSAVALTNPGNVVNTLAVDPPASFSFVNSGPLRLGPVSASGFSTATGAAGTTTVTDSTSLGNFQVQTLVGPITLAQNISTLNPGSNITLAAATLFNNAGSGRLTPGAGGQWRIWADTWVGENRGGLAPTTPNPNFYGCAFGVAACTSGVTLPAAGNRFVYVQRPTLTVRADDKSRLYGAQNPALTLTSVGLVNGDTAADAFSGTLSTTAQTTSSVGSYPIGATTPGSPVGYNVAAVTPGALAVTPAPLTITADNKLQNEGTANPPLTATFSGLVAGDTPAIAQAAGFALTTTADLLSPAGTYAIVPRSIVLGNYTVSTVSGTLLVIGNSRLENPYEGNAQPVDRYLRAQPRPAGGLLGQRLITARPHSAGERHPVDRMGAGASKTQSQQLPRLGTTQWMQRLLVFSFSAGPRGASFRRGALTRQRA